MSDNKEVKAADKSEDKKKEPVAEDKKDTNVTKYTNSQDKPKKEAGTQKVEVPETSKANRKEGVEEKKEEAAVNRGENAGVKSEDDAEVKDKKDRLKYKLKTGFRRRKHKKSK